MIDFPGEKYRFRSNKIEKRRISKKLDGVNSLNYYRNEIISNFDQIDNWQLELKINQLKKKEKNKE